MNPKDYQQYALSIDFFQNPAVNHGIGRFIELVVGCLPLSAKICDVGGGTGYILNLILQKRQNLSAILIEPATPMYSSGIPARITTSILQESLHGLECEDAFLFCRSFLKTPL